LENIFKEIADSQAKIELCIFEDILYQMKEIFTPKQKERFLELLERRFSNMNEDSKRIRRR
jgi:Spy/CpxP family protein refolding chaperone